METIYRKVAVSEKPKIEKWYHVINVDGNVDLCPFRKNEFFFTDTIGQREVKFWLEEIPQTIKSDNTEVILNLQKDKEEFLHFMKYFMQSLEDEDFIMTNNTDEDIVDNLLSTFNSLLQKHKQ